MESIEAAPKTWVLAVLLPVLGVGVEVSRGTSRNSPETPQKRVRKLRATNRASQTEGLADQGAKTAPPWSEF